VVAVIMILLLSSLRMGISKIVHGSQNVRPKVMPGKLCIVKEMRLPRNVNWLAIRVGQSHQLQTPQLLIVVAVIMILLLSSLRMGISKIVHGSQNVRPKVMPGKPCIVKEMRLPRNVN